MAGWHSEFVVVSRRQQFSALQARAVEGPVLKHWFYSDDHLLSYGEVVAHLRTNSVFRELLTEVLAAAPFDAIFWECVPVSADREDRVFQFVVSPSQQLASVTADPDPFRLHIAGGKGTHTVCVFPNLGNDARLVVPCANGALADYAHIVAFVRGAPAEQVHRLWQTLGEAVDKWLAESDQTVWVSTSGLGVYWAHVRLDSRPKYYTYRPYREDTEPNIE